MNWLSIMIPPIIGAVIGYCTNYIAVKMLFRPYRPIKIGKLTVPFTPGIIPKRKKDLAHAIGNMVGKSLVGDDELREVFCSEKMKSAVVDCIFGGVRQALDDKSVKDLATSCLSQNGYEKKRSHCIEHVSNSIVEGLRSIDIASIIVSEGTAAVNQMGGMIRMFVNEDVISSFAGPIAQKVDVYLANQGMDMVEPKVEAEFLHLEEGKVKDFLDDTVLESLTARVNELYDGMLNHGVSNIVNAFDICAIVEKKINDMEVSELEVLILSVMKQELGMVVNLGAVIGFVLGLLNLVLT